MRKAWVCAMLVVCACQTARPVDTGEEDVILGAPPDASEDPFQAIELPKDAVAAPASGTVGDPANPSRPQPSKVGPSELQPSKVEPKVDPPARVDPPAEPDKGVAVRTNPPAEPGATSYQCFSCVKICPSSDTTSDCSRSKEDMICGWGTSQSIEESMTAARGQCDAALNMARQMPQWSEISGRCPVASCR